MNTRALKRIVLGTLFGVAVGLGIYTFVYARGYSYLTNNPASCANCHIMNEQYDGWLKSSHRAVATCNDCHTPHNLVGKYTTKALNGFWHSFYFTTGGFHEPIRIGDRNLKITEEACQKCHAEITQAITTGANGAGSIGDAHAVRSGDPMSCIRCHRSVGHLH